MSRTARERLARQRVNATEVRRHIRILQDAGMTRQGIADMAGVPLTTVRDMGEWTTPEKRQAILSVPLPTTGRPVDMSWHDQASCRGDYGFLGLTLTEQRTTCADCPVRPQCVEQGLREAAAPRNGGEQGCIGYGGFSASALFAARHGDPAETAARMIADSTAEAVA